MAITRIIKAAKGSAPGSGRNARPFNTAELGIGALLCLLVDGLSALLELIPAVGYLPATALRSGANFGTSFWLMAKGGNARLERQLMKQAAGAVPFLPAVTAAFIIEAVIHNRGVRG